MNVDEVGYELYGLPPDQFTKERNARVKALVGSGDRQAAAAVRQLHKPAQSAWLANMLVRKSPREIDDLLELGRELRQAQEQGAGEEMRRLSTRRHELVQRLVMLASDVAKVAGYKLGKQLQGELEGTLDAAVADPAAAAELRGGRLVAPLSHVGFGEVGTLARGSRLHSQERQGKAAAPGPHEPRGAPSRAMTNQRAPRSAAIRALAKAQSAAAASREALDQARRRHDMASARRRDAAKELRDAEREYAQSSTSLEAADKIQKRDEQNLKQAEREYDRRQAKASES